MIDGRDVDTDNVLDEGGPYDDEDEGDAPEESEESGEDDAVLVEGEADSDFELDEYDKKTICVVRNLLKKEGESSSVLSSRREKAYRQATKSVYLTICSSLDLPIPTGSEKNKKFLHQAIVASVRRVLYLLIWRLLTDSLKIDADADQHSLLTSFLPDNTDLTHDAVLGKDIMAHVWRDMSQCRLPSWLSPAPPNWGTAARGKLSADNWKMVGTIHLPVTLIWIWRNEKGRKRELLDNFMDLVTAVRLSNMRVASAEQIDAYDHHISRYVSALGDLFGLKSLLPNHHGALHVGDNLRRFGPSQSHGASFYERHISFFHRINNNRKIGESQLNIWYLWN